MAAALSVNVSGCLLSSLFYEHVNSPGDQEGFLLGEVVSRITDTISDSQMCGEKEETSLNIYTVMPCEESFSFYGSDGKLHEEKLDSYLKDKRKKVIGWYKFRRNTPMEVSLREQAVHQNLCKVLSSTYDKFFIFGLFTCSTSSNFSTHSFDHIFLRSTGLKFEPLALNIINLGDTSHSEYRMYPHSAVNINSGGFHDTLSSVSSHGDSIGPVNLVQEIHTALQEKLESLQEQVGDSEAILASITLEIAELESKIAKVQTSSGSLTSDVKHDVDDSGEHVLSNKNETKVLAEEKIEVKETISKNIMKDEIIEEISRDNDVFQKADSLQNVVM